jgi:NADPH2:quinone reductase
MSKMRAIRVHEPGDVAVMRVEEVDMPEPQAGEARVRVQFAGLNFIDTYQRSGAYKLPAPFTPGVEAGGVVDALGPGTAGAGLRVGQRVAYCMVNGAYAEYTCVPVAKLVPVPDGIPLETAVALMVQGMTAHYLAFSTFPLGPEHTALIHAAAGGTGRLLVQVARRTGATLIGTAGNPQKAALARAAGADEVILYTEQDFEAEVKRLTGGKGVDVVYDSVGKTTFAKSLNCLRPRGMMVLWGQASGAVEPFDPQLLNQKGSLYLTRPSLGAYMLSRDELLWRAQELFHWCTIGELEVRIDAVYPLAEAAEAHRYIEGRRTTGKVLLAPA